MSVPITFTYPGDPPTSALLLFGAEFLQTASRPRSIRVTDIDGGELFYQHDLGDEVLCDLCNAPIAPTDPCALAHERLYCWPCATLWILKYLVT